MRRWVQNTIVQKISLYLVTFRWINIIFVSLSLTLFLDWDLDMTLSQVTLNLWGPKLFKFIYSLIFKDVFVSLLCLLPQIFSALKSLFLKFSALNVVDEDWRAKKKKKCKWIHGSVGIADKGLLRHFQEL